MDAIEEHKNAHKSRMAQIDKDHRRKESSRKEEKHLKEKTALLKRVTDLEKQVKLLTKKVNVLENPPEPEEQAVPDHVLRSGVNAHPPGEDADILEAQRRGALRKRLRLQANSR